MNTSVYHTNLCFQCLASRAQPPHPLSVTMTLSVQISVWRCPLNNMIIMNSEWFVVNEVTPSEWVDEGMEW